MLRTTTILALALATVPAHAQTIFKCEDPSGKIEYRNSACPSGTKSAPVEVPVASGKVLDIRRSADEGRDTRRDTETKEVPERPAPPAPVNALPPPPEKEK